MAFPAARPINPYRMPDRDDNAPSGLVCWPTALYGAFQWNPCAWPCRRPARHSLSERVSDALRRLVELGHTHPGRLRDDCHYNFPGIQPVALAPLYESESLAMVCAAVSTSDPFNGAKPEDRDAYDPIAISPVA